MNVGTGIPPRTGNGCASEVSRFIAVFDNQPMPLGDTARIGDEGKAAERTAPAALLSELSNEQKRHFVLAVTGSGAASRNVSLALKRPTSGCKSPSPDFVPAGAFLRDTPKIRFISTKSTEPIRRAATMVPESGCAVAKDRAGVASQRGDAPAPTTRTMLSKARTGEKEEPPVASSGPAALLSKLLAERNTFLCVLHRTRCNDPFVPPAGK